MELLWRGLEDVVLLEEVWELWSHGRPSVSLCFQLVDWYVSYCSRVMSVFLLLVMVMVSHSETTRKLPVKYFLLQVVLVVVSLQSNKQCFSWSCLL